MSMYNLSGISMTTVGIGRWGSPTTRDQTTSTLSEELVRTVLSALGYRIALCDAQGRVLRADDGWSDLLGSVDDDVGRLDPNLVPNRSPAMFEDASGESAVFVGLSRVTTALLPFHKDGDIAIVEMASIPLERADGTFLVAAREALGRAADDMTRRYLAAFVESTDLAIVGARVDGTILHWNAAATRIFGYRATEAIGQNVSMLVAPDRLSEYADVMTLLGRGDKVDDLDTIGLHKSGEPVEIHLSIMPTRNSSGAVVGSVAVVRDIGAFKTVDRRARLYTGFVETSPNGFMLWHHDPANGCLKLIAANRAARRVANLTSASIGRTSDDLCANFPALATLTWPPTHPLEHGSLSLGTFRVEGGAGATEFVELHAFPLTDSNVGLTLTDVTPQALAERERSRLLDRVADAEDAERKRLAEALHDDTIQVLAAANMELGSLRRRTDDPENAARAERIEEKIRYASRALRSLVFELYPPDLDSGGIAAGLRALVTRIFDDETEVEIVDDLDRRLGAETRITAYRILQEALGNSRRHARASHVSIRLAHDGEQLLAIYRDDGIGFDPAAVNGLPGHLGLRTMLERATSHGGSILVRRGTPSGTEIELRLPDVPGTVTAEAV
ncbi:MAG: putative histidine protein kinase [Acidimicrobiaceae bacterium]|nr:putative histidine protein kinase [Acidimicrobiaceae bacterium]